MACCTYDVCYWDCWCLYLMSMASKASSHWEDNGYIICFICVNYKTKTKEHCSWNKLYPHFSKLFSVPSKNPVILRDVSNLGYFHYLSWQNWEISVLSLWEGCLYWEHKVCMKSEHLEIDPSWKCQRWCEYFKWKETVLPSGSPPTCGVFRTQMSALNGDFDCHKQEATHDWRDLDQAMYSADDCTGVSYHTDIQNMPLLN